MRKLLSPKKKRNKNIHIDDLYIDSQNQNYDRKYSRIEKPISVIGLKIFLSLFLFLILFFLIESFNLQIIKGDFYRKLNSKNHLQKEIIFPQRGIIYDNNNIKLAYNVSGQENKNLAQRTYLSNIGLGHFIGFVSEPKKDINGFYIKKNYIPKSGIEKKYNSLLSGKSGYLLSEKDALGNLRNTKFLSKSEEGENLILTIDSRIQKEFYRILANYIEKQKFKAGLGLLVNLENGNIVSAVNYPDFDQNILSQGDGNIANYINNKRNPFLNRINDGLYTPGSILKPFLAYAILNEKLIKPEETLYSGEKISIQNPYNKDIVYNFHDWRVHGEVNIVKALAFSSNIFFYTYSGGFKNTKGLGIKKINEYLEKFELTSKNQYSDFQTKKGLIPNPEWKRAVYNSNWFLGDTYNSSIGQYSTSINPYNLLRSFSAIPTNGQLIDFRLTNKDLSTRKNINLEQGHLNIVKKGLREAVINERGTGKLLKLNFIDVAAKTGTAQIGRTAINSLVIGYFPYKKPKFAFLVVAENSKNKKLKLSSTFVIRELLISLQEKNILEEILSN